MQFYYKAQVYSLIIDVDHNMIIASMADPQKFRYFKNEITGETVKSISYSELSSISIPISETCKSGDSHSKLFDNNNLSISAIISKLCDKIDEQFKQ